MEWVEVEQRPCKSRKDEGPGDRSRTLLLAWRSSLYMAIIAPKFTDSGFLYELRALLDKSGQRLSFLHHKRRKNLHGRSAVIAPFMNIAALYKDGVTGFVCRGWFSLVIKGQNPLLHLSHQGTGMSMSAFSTSGRNLNGH